MNAVAKTIASGSAWSLGAQIISIVLQFAYASITSRLLDASAFGVYAVATLTVVLVSILSAAGLGQSIARSENIDQKLVRSLSTLAFIIGAFALLLILSFSGVWADIWGVPAGGSAIALVGFAAFIAPGVGLLSGVLRRRSSFKLLAVCVVLGTALGLFTSSILVYIFRSAEALVAGAVLTQACTYLALQIALRGFGLPGRVQRQAWAHLAFSWKVSTANLMAYGVENLTRFAVSKWLGASLLGYWNRGDQLTTMPLSRLHSSLSQTLYPFFRPGRVDDQASERLAHVLVIVAWVGFPLAAFLSGATPVLVPLIFGPGWDFVVPLAMILAVAAGLNGVSLQLASVLEAHGRFRWIWVTHGGLLLLQISAAFAVYATKEIWPAIIGALGVPIARHGVHLVLAHGKGLISLRDLLRGYAEVCVVGGLAFALAAFSSFLSLRFDLHWVSSMSLLGGGLIVGLVTIILCRRKISVFALLDAYGLTSRFGRG